MGRNIYNNPTGEAFCCFNDCNEDAIWEVRFGKDLEDYTHSCSKHIGDLIPQNCKTVDLLFISKTHADN